MKFAPLGAAMCSAALVAVLSPQARASGDDALASAQGEITTVTREIAGVQSAIEHAKSDVRSPEERLANGELLFRTNDFRRAIVVLSEILEEFQNTPSYPDALWLRGETYYASHDYLAARRDYAMLVARGNEAQFNVYFGRGLARLVDVSLRLNEPPEALGPIFEKFNPSPARAGRRGSPLCEGQGVLPPGLVERRVAGLFAGRGGDALHAPGTLLPGRHRDEGRAPACVGCLRDRRGQGEGADAILPGRRGVPRRHGAPPRHPRAPARDRPRVDGDRPVFL